MFIQNAMAETGSALGMGGGSSLGSLTMMLAFGGYILFFSLSSANRAS